MSAWNEEYEDVTGGMGWLLGRMSSLTSECPDDMLERLASQFLLFSDHVALISEHLERKAKARRATGDDEPT